MAEKLVPASALLLCIETPDQSTHTAICLLCMFGQSASQSSTLQHASTLRSYKAKKESYRRISHLFLQARERFSLSCVNFDRILASPQPYIPSTNMEWKFCSFGLFL